VPKVIRLGLTGGIGSGKSTVASMLVKRGIGLVDADEISRATTASGGAAIAALRSEFGAGFIDGNGALDRDRMRDLIYADAHAKKRLEAVVHPLVAQEIAAKTQNLVRAGRHCILFDIPLLVESTRWRINLDRVLVVDCPVDLQIERVMNRSTLPRQSVEKIIAAQASRDFRLQAADVVIDNGRITLTQLDKEVGQVAERLGLSSH
jgi:dephospho-CoA kinase